MTAPHIVDPAGLLSEALTDASPDLMRNLLQTMINALLSADADAVVGAVLAEQTDEWLEGRRYLGLDILAKSRLRLLPDTGPEEVTDSILELSA